MAEYLIKGESLTSIADKVRELTGTTGSLSFDDMQTKIDDANASMESVFNVLASKGIDIPDGANICDVADLIGNIGAELPELSNPATASELFANRELIDSDGNVVTGTFTIDSELTIQDDLIAQIQTALQNKAAGSGGGSVETCTVTINGSEENYGIITQYINGEFLVSYEMMHGTTFENVVCGSGIYARGNYLNASATAGRVLYVSGAGFYYQVPTTPGVTVTITLEQD